jgi:hypothetical protein
MSLEKTEKALEEGVFNKEVRKTAQTAVDEIIRPPIWLKVIAGGNIHLPKLVISLARDIKSWEEEGNHGAIYLQ